MAREDAAMSRPLMRQSELRRQFKTYFNDAELSAIEEKAHSAGLPASTFVREAAIGKKITQIPTINVEHWGELARLCGNINQIAKRIHQEKENISPSLWDEVLMELLLTKTAADCVRASIIAASESCSSN